MEDAPMHQGLLQAALSGDVATLVQLSDEVHLSGVAAGGNTAAHLASKLGHLEFLTEILRRCPSLLFRRNSTKDTALHCAARVGNDACVRILLEEWRRSTAEGDLPGIADASGGATASSIPASRPDEATQEDKEGVAEVSGGENSVARKNTEECNEVKKKKNMPKWRNKRGNTALHDAARKRHVQVVRTLLEADPQLASITNNAGASALRLAYDLSTPEMVEILVKYQPRTSHQLDGGDGQPSATIYGFNATRDRPRKSSNTTAGVTRKQEGRPRDEINQTTILINKLILTAVSVATFTFSAPIALPTGGDSNKGGLSLEKKIALLTFLVSDAVAMVSAVVIVCLLVKMGFVEHGAALLETIHKSRKLARVAIAALVVVFASGTYFVFAFDDAWSAVVTCLIAGAVPFAIYAVTWWPII